MNTLVACTLWALQSGEPDPTMFPPNTLELYAAAPNNPDNYGEVQNRCLGSVAARLADREITTFVYAWKAA